MHRVRCSTAARDRWLWASVVLALSCVPGVSEMSAQSRLEPSPGWASRHLAAVPLPSLDALEAAVGEQIRTALAGFDTRRTSTRTTPRELADAYGELGRLFHVYEFVDAAEAAYENAIRLSPTDARWPHLLGHLYQQTGRSAEAAERFVAARRNDPSNHAATLRLADAYVQLDRLREAQVEYARVQATFPALARTGLGEVALRERRYSDAAAHFRVALDLVPAATSLRYSLAMAYRGLGRLDEAQAQLARRGTATIRIGDPLVDGLQSLVRGERGLVAIGRRALDAGDARGAAELFGRAVQTVPTSVAARVNLGVARARLGDSPAAVEQFEAALRIEPQNAAAHAGLGAVLAFERRDAEAVPHLETAAREGPEDIISVRLLIGALVRLRREDDAVAVLEGAHRRGVDDEDATVGVALLLADRERYRDAVRVLAQANEHAPDQVSTATTLARLLASAPDLGVRDGARALALAKEVFERSPEAVHAETVAMALAEAGQCAEARDWMARAVGAAQAEKDTAQLSRLRAVTAQYAGVSCRPPGR